MTFPFHRKIVRSMFVLFVIFGVVVVVIVKVVFLAPPPQSVLTQTQKDQALEKMLGRSVSNGVPTGPVEMVTRETSILSYQYQANAHILLDSTNPSLNQDDLAPSPIATTSPSLAKVVSKPKKPLPPDPNLIDNFSYSLPIHHLVVAIHINRLTAGQTQLTEISGVNLRQSDPKTYQPFSVTLPQAKNGRVIPYLAFSQNQDTTQKVLFFLDQNVAVSVAVTGYVLSDVDPIFQQLVSSIVFHD